MEEIKKYTLRGLKTALTVALLNERFYRSVKIGPTRKDCNGRGMVVRFDEERNRTYYTYDFVRGKSSPCPGKVYEMYKTLVYREKGPYVKLEGSRIYLYTEGDALNSQAS